MNITKEHGHYKILTVALTIQPEESSTTEKKADGF